jgi:opacity protein-like surface antigen
MRRLALVLLVSISILSTSSAQNVSLSFHGGMAFPTSPSEFSSYWSSGYNVGGGMSYYLFPFIEVRGQVEYAEFQLDAVTILEEAEIPPGLVTITGGEVSGLFLSGVLKILPLPDAPIVRPYGLVGGGFAALSVSDVMVSALGVSESVSGASEKAAMAIVGAGIDIVVSPSVDLFLEGRYIITYTEDEQLHLLPASFGIRIRF